LSDGLSLAFAFTIGFAATYALTPLAIRIAERSDFFDHPRGYKAHAMPTPYLGGIAVLGGFGIAVLALGEDLGRLWPILVGAIALSIAGTIDDRRSIGPGARLAVEIVAALSLFAAGLGWEYLPSDGTNLALTILFVVGVVNAFNLMDNQDGATGTVTMVAAAGIGALALIEGDVALAALCLALAGACGGFLPYNLAGPARIFLGDGGSMPVGFILAASLMSPSSWWGCRRSTPRW
jgi:UDP-GlcNAc:undecaprenyl-phosphate GlcNAc-1-phosphate transferase